MSSSPFRRGPCTSRHLNGCHGNNSRLWIQTFSQSTLVVRPGLSDLYLFPKMKKSSDGRHLAGDIDGTAASEEFLESQPN